MLDFKNISVHYGLQDVLTDVSFRVNKYERVGVVGPNGSGKSTLFKIILGETSADHGELVIEEKPRIGSTRQHPEPDTPEETLLDYSMRGIPGFQELELRMRALEEKLDSGDLNVLREYGEVQTEFEHLGDYADKMADAATTIHEENISLSKTALNEIGLTETLVREIIDFSSKAFEKRNVSAAYHIEPSVDVLLDIVSTLHDNHLVRLREGMCTVRGGVIFSDILTNVERIGKTCSNIGIATIARVSSEVENSKHSYTASIHQGKNEDYNREYERTHEVYYGRLAVIDKEEPVEVKDV